MADYRWGQSISSADGGHVIRIAGVKKMTWESATGDVAFADGEETSRYSSLLLRSPPASSGLLRSAPVCSGRRSLLVRVKETLFQWFHLCTHIMILLRLAASFEHLIFSLLDGDLAFLRLDADELDMVRLLTRLVVIQCWIHSGRPVHLTRPQPPTELLTVESVCFSFC